MIAYPFEKVALVDTRNQKDSFVVNALEELGYKVLRTKLPFGDVALTSNILNVIDLKSSGGGLIELSKNICSSDHERLRREIKLCSKFNGKITFLCFEEKIKSIEDIENWEVPTYKSNQYKDGILIKRKGDPLTKVKPITLMKAIKTMSEPNHYDCEVNFAFTNKKECGNKILEILGGLKK